MRHQLADQDVLLTAGTELRPVLRDRGIDVQFAAIGQHQRGEAGYRLSRGPDVGDGVLGPRDRPGLVGEAAPDVDDDVAVDVQDQRRAQFFPGIQVPFQCRPDRPELVRAHALYIRHVGFLLVVGPTLAAARAAPLCGWPRHPAISAARTAPSSQQASRSGRAGVPATQTGGLTARPASPVAMASTARTAPPVSMPPCTYRP